MIWCCEKSLINISSKGAENLYEAIQSFIIMWQIMCLEQTPNPFAFSVGNADRIFEPYRNGLDRDTTAALLKHFLVFFNVADRSWAISQNLIVSGRDENGNDLTNETTYVGMINPSMVAGCWNRYQQKAYNGYKYDDREHLIKGICLFYSCHRRLVFLIFL